MTTKMFLTALTLMLALEVHGYAEVVSYECDSVPELSGFTRLDRNHLANRWNMKGEFFQKAKIWHPDPPRQGQDDLYRYELQPFADTQHFFLEWRVKSNALREEYSGVGGASIAAAGRSGVLFHYTIVRDQVRFLRGNPHPIIFSDFKRRVYHDYRLDVYNEHWFEWTVDGEIQAWGVPDRTYPENNSFLIFGGRANIQKTVQSWDYIRFGDAVSSDVACDMIDKLHVSCRGGKIKAKVKSSLPEDTELLITNNGHHKTMTINANGNGKVKYKKQSDEHTILLLDCPQISEVVDCSE